MSTASRAWMPPEWVLRHVWWTAAGLSAVAHLAFMTSLVLSERAPTKSAPEPVKIAIAELPPKEKKLPPRVPEKPKKVVSERAPKSAPVPDAKPIAGLSKESFQADSGVAVAAGNTLMKEDDGTRVAPDQVKELTNEDLSADARLIMNTMKIPQYTSEAVDANLEGSVTVDVYVDTEGNVVQAEIPRKVGYGMDERIIEAARASRFTPRKDRYGNTVAGWTELKFRLVIPD